MRIFYYLTLLKSYKINLFVRVFFQMRRIYKWRILQEWLGLRQWRVWNVAYYFFQCIYLPKYSDDPFLKCKHYKISNALFCLLSILYNQNNILSLIFLKEWVICFLKQYQDLIFLPKNSLQWKIKQIGNILLKTECQNEVFNGKFELSRWGTTKKGIELE